MLHESRAIIFDLDDTLYPLPSFPAAAALRRWPIISRACAASIGSARCARCAVPRTHATRGREIQVALRTLRLPPGLLSGLTERDARHTSRGSGFRRSAAVTLAALRPRLEMGVLTNGDDGVQARKISGARPGGCVDSIVYATRYGTGAGKPEAAPFKEIAAPARDAGRARDLRGQRRVCDIGGAAAVGMRTVRVTGWSALVGPSTADAVIASLRDLPAVAGRLLGEAPSP